MKVRSQDCAVTPLARKGRCEGRQTIIRHPPRMRPGMCEPMRCGDQGRCTATVTKAGTGIGTRCNAQQPGA